MSGASGDGASRSFSSHTSVAGIASGVVCSLLGAVMLVQGDASTAVVGAAALVVGVVIAVDSARPALVASPSCVKVRTIIVYRAIPRDDVRVFAVKHSIRRYWVAVERKNAKAVECRALGASRRDVVDRWASDLNRLLGADSGPSR